MLVSTSSLSGACAVYIGKPLLKSEQMSNWDKRPLSMTQLHYASLDAHSTLTLLDTILLKCGVPSSDALNLIDKFYLDTSSSSSSSSTVSSSSPV